MFSQFLSQIKMYLETLFITNNLLPHHAFADWSLRCMFASKMRRETDINNPSVECGTGLKCVVHLEEAP